MTLHDVDEKNLPRDMTWGKGAAINLAATAIVLRGTPPEVLLLRRHESSRLLPGSWVFAGGRIEAEDGRDTLMATLRAGAVRQILEETQIRIDSPDSLVWTSRWITPDGAPRRFDTYFFFFAEAPADAVAVADQIEGMDVLWITPREALTRHARGDLPMVLPTIKNLEAIADCVDIETLLTSRRSAQIMTTQPVLVDVDGRKKVLLNETPSARRRNSR